MTDKILKVVQALAFLTIIGLIAEWFWLGLLENGIIK